MIQGGRAAGILEARLREIATAGGAIVDLGTPQRFHKELRPYERLFEGRDYRAYGYQPQMIYDAYNCEGHQDIEAMSFADDSIDAVICLDVLEHVQDPFKAAREIARILRPGGLLLITVPFLAGYHGKEGGEHSHEGYPDYWRMTHAGLKYLFRDFAEADVTPLDGPIAFRLKHLYMGRLLGWAPFLSLVEAVDRPAPGRTTSRHLLFGRK